jgi:hypothetical protein
MRAFLNVPLAAMAIILTAGVPAASARAGFPGNCDEKLEKQAHDQPEPKDWNALYHLYKEFGVCDRGATSERFSADVAQLFSKQWTHLDTLGRLAATDKGFEQFVLSHIDINLDEDDLLHISDNAEAHCPAGEKRICGLIHARAQKSLDDQREISE